jgi:methylmalonyl-CoA mutase
MIPKSFADLPLGGAVLPKSTSAAAPWESPEGIGILPVYGPEHLDGLDALATYPGLHAHIYAGHTRRCTSPSLGRSASTPGFSTAEESNAFYRRNFAAGRRACR